jgi:hypothetical protein
MLWELMQPAKKHFVNGIWRESNNNMPKQRGTHNHF